MPRPRDTERRDELVNALVDVYARGGLGARSLREQALELGTSRRMLIHHFGSREEMLVAVVETVERRQAAILATLEGSPPDVAEQVWNRLSNPALRPFERLFFECYARGANGEAPFDRLLPGAVTSWLDAGVTNDPALARLGLSVIRGLLLDLVATGDERSTRDAWRRYVQLVLAERRDRSSR